MREFQFGCLVEHFLRQVRGHVTGAEVVAVGLGCSEFEEIVQRLSGHRRMHGDDVRLLDQLRDGRKIALHTKRHLVIHPRRDGCCTDLRDDQRITIGVGFGADGGAAGALRATAVVDQQLLAGRAGERRLNDARHQVRATAGRERHDQTDGFVRVHTAALVGGKRGQRNGGEQGSSGNKAVHTDLQNSRSAHVTTSGLVEKVLTFNESMLRSIKIHNKNI